MNQPPRLLRGFNGFARQLLTIQQVRELTTTIDCEFDYWNAVEYYSEIETHGVDLVQRCLPTEPDPRSVFLLFQAFIRQAKSFYTSAKALHYRSSSLLYYYSFLNLAKSLLVLRHPTWVSGRVHHGLRYDSSAQNMDFISESVTVDNGIFQMLYEVLMSSNQQHTIHRGFTLNIAELLSYCSGIGYQYELSMLGVRKITPGYLFLFVDTNTNSNWSMIAIRDLSSHAFYQSLETQITIEFQEVFVDTLTISRYLNLPGNVLWGCKFFESIDTLPMHASHLIDVPALVERAARALMPFVTAPVYPDSPDFLLYLPLDANMIPMNEELAIYATMFYLSSLVRYRASYLELLFNQTPAWLIESFVTSAPQTFLRCIVNRIIGTHLVIRQLS